MSVISKIVEFLTPAKAGKENEMAEQTATPTATPPVANGGGITAEQLSAAIAEAVKPFGAAIEGLQKSHGEHAASLKAISDRPGGLKAEDVATHVTRQLEAHHKAQAESQAKSHAKGELRKSVVAAKLPGVPDNLLAALPDTDDKAALEAAADGLRKSLDAMGAKANVGGAAGGAGGDGGKTPAAATPDAAKKGFLKMPGGAAATA